MEDLLERAKGTMLRHRLGVSVGFGCAILVTTVGTVVFVSKSPDNLALKTVSTTTTTTTNTSTTTSKPQLSHVAILRASLHALATPKVILSVLLPVIVALIAVLVYVATRPIRPSPIDAPKGDVEPVSPEKEDEWKSGVLGPLLAIAAFVAFCGLFVGAVYACRGGGAASRASTTRTGATAGPQGHPQRYDTGEPFDLSEFQVLEDAEHDFEFASEGEILNFAQLLAGNPKARWEDVQIGRLAFEALDLDGADGSGLQARVPVGIRNRTGSACFAIALTQALAWTLPDLDPVFKSFLREAGVSELIARNNLSSISGTREYPIYIFLRVVTDLQKGYRPTDGEFSEYLAAVKASGSEISSPGQHDATAALEAIANLIRGYVPLWNQVNRHMGVGKDELRTCKSGHEMERYVDNNNFLHYGVAVTSDNPSVQDAIARELEWHTNRGDCIKCRVCSSATDMETKTVAVRMGTVLAVSARCMCPIENKLTSKSPLYPLELLSVGDRFYYAMEAAVVHINPNGGSSGHYVAYLRVPGGGERWFKANDSEIRLVRQQPEVFLGANTGDRIAIAFYR